MKILITSDTYFPRLGGGEVYAYQLATFLKRSGHEVEIFTTEQGEWKDPQDFVTHRPVFSKNPIKLFKFLKAYYIAIKRADVVHSIYSHKVAAICSFLRIFAPTTHVISLQGWGILDLPGNSYIRTKAHRLYRWISLKRAHVAVASCKEFVEIAERYIPRERIEYVPNLVDIDEFTDPGKDYPLLPFKYENQPLIFTIRRLVPKNGIQFLVETAPLIIEKHPKAKFVLIGWGRLDEYLRKRASELGVEKNIYFLGRIENYKLKKYLNLADMVIFPSTAESTSIACLESMSLGKPIVASNVGGFPEMVIDGHNGFLVNLTDNLGSDYGAPMDLPIEKKENLMRAISELIEDEEKRKKFGLNSRKRIENHFTWQKNIERIISFYNKE